MHDPRAAASLIGKTAQLEFYDLEADLTGPSKSVSLQGQPVAEPNVYSLLAGQQALVKEKGAGEWYLLDKTSKKVIAGPATTREALFATKAAKKLKITQRSLQGRVELALAPGGAAEGDGEGEGQADVRRLRRPEEDRRHLLRHRRGRVPRRQRHSDEQDVVPLQVRPGQPERPARSSPART